MKYTYLIAVLAILISTSLYSQEVLKTNSGQRILLVDDGSWRVVSETESIEGETTASGTSLNSFKSPKQGKYPVSPDQREEIQNLLTNYLSDEAQLLVNIEMEKRKLNQLKEEKSEVKKDKEKSEKIKGQISQSKESIEQNESFYKKTSKLIKLSNELLDGKIKNRDKAFASLEINYNSSETLHSGMGGQSTDDGQVDGTETVEPETPAKSLLYPVKFDLEEDKGSRDEYDCEIVFDGYDKEIGSDRREVKTQPFFSYSQEKMKPYFKTEDYLSCDANISKVDKNYFLTLKIRIRSKDASKTYGLLRANENINIKLINGRNVYAKNINSDSGKIESYTGHTLYTGIFLLKKSDINDLKKYYLDNIGIIWSSGYEEYNIYNVDFLTNQIKCLTK